MPFSDVQLTQHVASRTTEAHGKGIYPSIPKGRLFFVGVRLRGVPATKGRRAHGSIATRDSCVGIDSDAVILIHNACTIGPKQPGTPASLIHVFLRGIPLLEQAVKAMAKKLSRSRPRVCITKDLVSNGRYSYTIGLTRTPHDRLL
jgi:hypothetical protein